MSTPSIVIASAARTAVGSFNGAFANTPAHQLGATVIADVVKRAGVAPDEVDEVILGQILSAGEGQNPARQASIRAGMPKETTAWGLNQLCGSGLRAVALAAQQIASGDAITVRMLLNHTSGIYSYTDDQGFGDLFYQNPFLYFTAGDLVRIGTSHPPVFPPGTDWSYSNTN